MSKKKVYNKDEIDKIINLYKENNTLKEISKIFNTKPDKISKILKQNNIQIKKTSDYYDSKHFATNKKYIFDEDYFEIINENHKAYWLGFLYADGHVRLNKSKNGSYKGGTVEIGLKNDDSYHLFNFLFFLKGNVPVKLKNVKLNDKIYPSCRLNLNSVKMANDLIKHGCVERKSLILKFPYNLDNNLLSHFIRGYIDGDGCIAFYTYELNDSFHVSLLGTFEFLSGVKSTLENNNIECSNVKSEESKAFCLRIYGRDNLTNLYNYLYKDAEVFLGRKYEKFKNALLYFEKEFNISETAKICTLLLNEDLKNKIYHKKIIRPNI